MTGSADYSEHMAAEPEELLFSYAELRDPQLQLDMFGRVLPAEPDTLPGYTVDYVEIDDIRFNDRTGRTVHPHLRPTGDTRDKVVGALLRLTPEEFVAADEFEVAMFRRARVTLGSGREAWVYVTA